jgi:nitrite reductase (NO-forming)
MGQSSIDKQKTAEEAARSRQLPHRYLSRKTWKMLGLVAAVIVILTAAFAAIQVKAGIDASANTAQGATVKQVVVPPYKYYNPVLPPVPQGDIVNVQLEVQENLITIAPGVAYHAWTYDGTVPGPVIHLRQGQTIHFTLINHGTMPHAIDFHAAETPWNVNYQAIPANSSFSFNWKANYPGVFLYHCGAAPVIAHMSHGMYGMVVVDPASQGYAQPADVQYAILQSEFYIMRTADGSYVNDDNKALNAGTPDYVTFNGYSNQYEQHPLVAKVGQRIRIFIGNAGVNHFSAIHVIGAIIKDVYVDGNPGHHFTDAQTIIIPPGGASVIDLVIPQAGEYPLITHDMSDMSKGAVALINVTN